ncbi:hypothetical protein KKA47_05840 [bacterium]|nr:hypothetical protein [bacterium]
MQSFDFKREIEKVFLADELTDEATVKSHRSKKMTIAQFLSSAEDIGSKGWDQNITKSESKILEHWNQGDLSSDEKAVLRSLCNKGDIENCAYEGIKIYLKHCLYLFEIQGKIGDSEKVKTNKEIFHYLRRAVLSDHTLSEHGKRLWLIYVAIREYTFKRGSIVKCLRKILGDYDTYLKEGYCEWRYEIDPNLPYNIVELTASQIKVMEYGKSRVTSKIKKILSKKEGYDVTYQSFEHMSSYQGNAYYQHILRVS